MNKPQPISNSPSKNKNVIKTFNSFKVMNGLRGAMSVIGDNVTNSFVIPIITNKIPNNSIKLDLITLSPTTISATYASPLVD